MTKVYEIENFCKGKPKLVDWRSKDLGSKKQRNCKNLVRSLWGNNLLSIPMMKTIYP